MSDASVPFVPWTCTAEWLRVYSGLYSVDWRAVCVSGNIGLLGDASDDECSRSPFGCATRPFSPLGKEVDEALAIGAVWTVRSETHAVPPAVEATLSLVRALRDWAASVAHEAGDGLSADTQTVRHALGMAIVRAVNDAVEPQQRAAHAVSVSRIAGAIGMPQSLVEVRHAATHNAMPLLEALLDSAVLMLSWLRTAYWEPQRLWAAEACSAVKGAVSSFLIAALPDDTVAEDEQSAKRPRATGGPGTGDAQKPGRCAASIGERPLQTVVTRFLSDVPHIASSPVVQRMLCDAIVEALLSKPGDAREAALALLVHALMVSAEVPVFSSLLDACLERETLPAGLVTRAASRISDARTLRSAATRCVLACRADVWRAIVAGRAVPAAMDALVVRLLEGGTEASSTAADLLQRSSQVLLAVQPSAKPHSENCSELYAPVHGWNVLAPPPLGCTATFNLARDYALLYSV